MRPALLLAVLALLAAPASAEVTVGATGPEEPVTSDAPVPLLLEVTLDCLTLWSREVVTVRFDATAPANATLEGPESADYHKTDCPSPDGEAVKQHPFEATVLHAARAGTVLPFHLAATVPGDALEPESFGVAQVDLVPAYVPLLQASAPQQIKQTGTGSASYTIHLENLGNDDVDVTIHLDKPPGHGGVVDLPEPLRLARGESVERSFTLRFDHDGWDHATARVGINATRAGAEGTDEGAEQLFINVLLRNGSLTANARDIPATGLLPLALLGAALAVRRR